jgi:hypothetical protein
MAFHEKAGIPPETGLLIPSGYDNNRIFSQ